MQTQIQQTSKKNKVTVPFYSPSYRLYEQTSADIIKEARAAVMTTPPVGIKPVFTSRPFTPNQTERTLFGNVKKSKSRPPSSFSLRPKKNEEPSSRVKLPSIEIISRRKDYSTFHYSKNLSLDNLTEDYDAEVFEEVTTIASEKLPTWKKSHSCPKEGRLTKVASLNDINHFVDPNNPKKEEKLNPYRKQNFELKQYDYTSKESSLFGDYIKLDQDEVHSDRQTKNPVLTKGGGDYEVPESTIKNVTAYCSNQKTKVNSPLLVDDIDLGCEQKYNPGQEQKTEVKNIIKTSTDTNKDCLTELESTEKSEDLAKETKNEQKEVKEKEQLQKSENSAEKSVVTGSKSEYLMSLRSDYKNTEIVKQSEALPLEILELYETAKYYGVDVNQNGNKASPRVANSTDWSVKFAEKTNISGSKDKENSEKIKNRTTEEHETSSGHVEYLMNNKKRYHTSSNKNENVEKAYKKWNSKEEKINSVPQSNALNDSWDLFWKNSYYVDQEGIGEESKEDVDRDSLRRLVNQIAGLVKKGVDNREICEAISELYSILKNNKLILDSKIKERILKVLYLFVDNENPELLLSLAKIFFQLKEENSLSVACKIIFKVARFDTNDHLFLNEEDILELFLEGIGRASPLECAESCIYSYGALKFLTLNHGILSKLLHMGALDLMTLHLKMINNAYVENGSVGEQTQHVLFQLTGALRHIAAGEGALPLFLTTNCIAILCNTLRFFFKDEDVTVNISRTLSLLSTDEIVTQALMQVDNILTTLIDLIERYRENDKILIRLAFCLGNIVEHSDLARVQLSRSDSSLTVLLNVLKLYIDKDLKISLEEGNGSNSTELSSEVVDDVIVKIIRIIANMSMNPIVGSNLSPATKEKKSLQLSKLLSVLLTRKDPGITLLATLGCLNNISYYCNTHSALIDITQGVERVLGLESVECQIESARVLGNLTRHREIRDLIYSTGGVDLLIKLLSSPDQEVVRCACGALVNMMLDAETRKSFVEARGIDKLVRALEVFPGDWSLASLATRAIWNSCGDDLSSAMLHNNVEHLLSVLASSLEEENWNDGDVTWEEFASVATDLLEKISSHLEST